MSGEGLLQTGQTDPLVTVLAVVGVVVLAGLGVVYRIVFFTSVGGGDAGSNEPMTNCGGCGTRIPADRDRCESCAETAGRA